MDFIDFQRQYENKNETSFTMTTTNLSVVGSGPTCAPTESGS